MNEGTAVGGISPGRVGRSVGRKVGVAGPKTGVVPTGVTAGTVANGGSGAAEPGGFCKS